MRPRLHSRSPLRVAARAAVLATVASLLSPGCIDFGDAIVVPMEQPPEPGLAVARVSITVAPTSVEVGRVVAFTAEALDENDRPVPGAAITWTSSDETRATIGADGRARGIAPGSVQIRAESNGVQSPQVTLDVVSTAPDFETQIQPILTRSCAVVGCHSGAFPTQGLNLSAGLSHAALVGRPSTVVGGAVLVRPGDAANSYLLVKLTCTSCPSGLRMPRFGPPLPGDEIDLIRDWIDAGALP